MTVVVVRSGRPLLRAAFGLCLTRFARQAHGALEPDGYGSARGLLGRSHAHEEISPPSTGVASHWYAIRLTHATPRKVVRLHGLSRIDVGMCLDADSTCPPADRVACPDGV